MMLVSFFKKTFLAIFILLYLTQEKQAEQKYVIFCKEIDTFYPDYPGRIWGLFIVLSPVKCLSTAVSQGMFIEFT